MMDETREFLSSIGLPGSDAYDLPDSERRFPDGAQYRIEIPSTEGPAAIRTVVEAAEKYRVPVHRVSQGSGIMLMTDDEIREMLRIGRDNGMEVSLFVGPRSSWDTSAQMQTPAGKSLGARHRGMDQVVYALEDIRRGCDLGLRGVLVADLGLLSIVQEMKKAGKLPASLVVKISVQMGASNPATVRLLEQLGAGTVNPPTDLTLPQLGAIRQASGLPIDLYIEAGFECLQPLEAKASMDVRKLCPAYGDRMAFFGNIDVMVMGSNDRQKVEHEVRSKLAAGMATNGYAYHSDHSVPPTCSWATYQFIVDLLNQYGIYG